MPSSRSALSRNRLGYVPLVEVWRGDAVESVHYGAITAVDSRGRVVGSAGDSGIVTFLRSAAKPAQVLPLLASGAIRRFDLTPKEIAVMIGSHGGEPAHVAAVRSILGKIGLEESALQCGSHAPFHRPSSKALRAAGLAPTALHNNCSGKHAGMLALAVHWGAPVRSYLDPAHPVQKAIRGVVETMAGLEPGGALAAVDGCSAPTFAMPLLNAALLYARLQDPEGLGRDLAKATRRAAAAMRRHPLMVAGHDRLCTELMRAPRCRLIAKIGAEGFYGLAFRKNGAGYGIALKIADGDGDRARPAAALAACEQLGALPGAVAAALLARFGGEVRSRRGAVVGRIVTSFGLRDGAGFGRSPH